VLLHLDPDTRRILRTIDVFGGRQESFPYRSNNQAYLQGSSVLWWGTTGLGLYRVDLTTGSVRNFYSQSRVGRGGIALSVVPAGDDRSLWIAGHNDGLLKFDVRSGEFRRIPSKAWSAYTHIMKDRAGLLWLATETAGVLTYDPATASEVVYAHDPTDSTSLSHSWARATLQDSEGRIWVGAGNVVNLVDSIRGTFTRYSNAKHADAIFNSPVGMDNFGRLWTSFSTGVLAVLEPTTGAFTNLGPADGICGYVTDMEVLSDGRVVLAGESGLNLFDPRAISLKRMPPPLRITRLTINDGAVPPVDLDGAAGALQLTYEQNVIEIEFAALDMQAPGSIDYRYQLVGLEPDWVRLQNRRYVRYSGLPPGDYRFSVVASPGRDEWPEQEVALDILIAPPWWRTPWAYILYALFTLGFMYGAYLTWLGRFRLKQQAAMEHFQAARLADVDRLKSRFFANISHEFRTPLTLILGPIRKWRERTGIDAEARDLETAERNARRLLGLVNQLLDLSKIEAQAMRVRARLMNVVPLIRGVANSFESTADLKGISLDVRADRDAIVAYIDPDMLEKILTNLISNAFKFTQTGGRVAVEAAVVSGDGVVVSTPAEEEGFLEILVSDTGIGISPEDIPRLFDRFYQVDSSQARAYEGTGIGLALVKELVDLHHGSVGVKSRAGHGSEFRVRLPLGRRHLKDEEITASEAPVATPHAERGDAGIALVPADSARTDGIGQSAGVSGVADEAGPVEGKPVVLVVEDNVDVRVYIKEQLVASYNVLEAEDGAKGVERALEAVPDLIISDIMMPGMDGYRLCRILKEDEKTSHIPIILLTAKAGTEHRIEGLETGADDYLIKPFEPKELVARVRNLIEVRRKLRARFNVPLRPGDIVVASMDDAFLKKAVEAVERHMGEEAFGVTELGEALAMSRVQLHRKITALTDRPPGEFIRYLRLHRAMELLKRDAGTVSEIAYSVGFSDPSHFTRRFRELFGTLPSDVRKNPSDQT
jgi:signal transduction histidine kinase/DNA-binding response OmpR family regulator/streptogramin lyase